MKKIISIIVILLSITSVSAQKSSIIEYNKTPWAAFGYNCSGYSHKGVNGMCGMMNILGVHVDYAFNAEGNNEGNSGIDRYYGYETYAWHLGYSIPVTEYFKVTPVIGMSKWGEGYYDGLDYTIDENGIHNQFNATYEYRRFDYGVVLSAEIKKTIVLYVNLERENIGVGIGVTFQTGY